MAELGWDPGREPRSPIRCPARGAARDSCQRPVAPGASGLDPAGFLQASGEDVRGVNRCQPPSCREMMAIASRSVLILLAWLM